MVSVALTSSRPGTSGKERNGLCAEDTDETGCTGGNLGVMVF